MADPRLEVLTPQNSQIIFIDHQPQMAFGVQSIDRQTLKNNVVALAKAAKVFKVPTTITTVTSQSFAGYAYPELLDVFPVFPQSASTWFINHLYPNRRRRLIISMIPGFVVMAAAMYVSTHWFT